MGSDIGMGGGGGKTRVSSMGGLAGLIFMIVTTELTIHRNPSVHNDLKEWTFGQTLSVIMLGQQILDGFRWWKKERQVNVRRWRSGASV
jgi:hypothetical protein